MSAIYHRRLAAVAAAVGLGLAATHTFAQDPELVPRAIVPMVGTDRAEHPVEGPFREARQQWAAAGIDDYTIVVTIARFGPGEHHIVVVEDGEVASIESVCTIGPDPWECGEVVAERFTVEGLFQRVAEALARTPPTPSSDPFDFPGNHTLEADFAAPAGIPVFITTGHTAIADLGEGLWVERFTLADPVAGLALARATWEAEGWREYGTRTATFDASEGSSETRGVDVRDGVIISSSTECSASETAPPEPCELDPGAEQATVEGMFDLVESLLADDALDVEVLYAVADGHVERVTWGPTGSDPDTWDAVQVVQFDPL